MLKTTNPTGLSTMLQLLINATDKNEVGTSCNNKTNLSNPSLLKRSTKAGYLIFESAKKGGNNSKGGGNNNKNSFKAAKSSNYLTSDAKKTFNYLQHIFIQVPIL